MNNILKKMKIRITNNTNVEIKAKILLIVKIIGQIFYIFVTPF